jgi:spermidine synthase
VTSALPTGTHIRLLLAGCRCPAERLRRHVAILPALEREVRACGMTPLASAGHDFAGAGTSLCLVLAESHLALHTYPEQELSVVVELTVCDHRRENRERARRLADRIALLFEPAASGRDELEMSPALPDASR